MFQCHCARLSGTDRFQVCAVGRFKCGTWPGSRSFSQPSDTLHQVLKTGEALVSAVGQNRLGIDEESGQSESGTTKGNFKGTNRCKVTFK